MSSLALVSSSDLERYKGKILNCLATWTCNNCGKIIELQIRTQTQFSARLELIAGTLELSSNNKTMYGDLKSADIPASESLSIALNTANTAPIPILSWAADNRWWSRDVLNENFSAEEWSWDMRSVDSSRSLSNRWHVNLAPGSASWFSTPDDKIINDYTTSRGRSGGLMISALDSARESWLEPCPGTLGCVLGQDTLLSRCLSPPWCITGYPQNLMLGVTLWWTSIRFREEQKLS